MGQMNDMDFESTVETQPVQPDEKLRSDARLMRAVACGDDTAKRELIKLLWKRVYLMVRHMCPFFDEVEDLTQDIMVEILKSANHYQATGCVEAWANVITMRTVMKRIRKVRRKQQTFMSDEVYPVESAPSSTGNAERETVSKARRECVEDLMGKLGPDERAVMVLKVMEGHSVEETAEILGKKADAVRYLFKKARSKLSQLVMKNKKTQDLLLGSQS